MHLPIIAPAKILGGPDELTVRRGDILSVDFEIAGYPEPDIVWIREVEQEEVIVTERLDILKTARRTSMLIQEVVPEDAGEYLVSVQNTTGKDLKKVKVLVLGKK